MTRDAFNIMVHATYRKLYLIAFRLLRNQQEAEDVVQDVYLKMWMMKDKLDEYRDKEALAVTMTRNSSIDMLRKLRHRVNDPVGSLPALTVHAPSPYDLMAGSETMSALNEIINNLPSMYREVVILRDIDGLSYEEIAKITSANINSLRVNLSRARQMIREKFKHYSYERGEAEGTA